VLWVIMPVYNEEAAVGRVVAEWLSALRTLDCPFRLLAINDGSRDGTLAILQRAAAANPEIAILDQPNRGHGQSCVRGYRLALDAGAEWVLQIDSDGQCDPRFLAALWASRARHPAVLGRRVTRDDGWLRRVASRGVALVVWLATRTWVPDANVPYRLVRRDALEEAVSGVPADFQLANVLVAVRLQRRFGIRWIPIHFRDRLGGSPSVKARGLLGRGVALYRALRREGRTRP
jgi:dolichol-phosphate mannosyltransferase